MIAADTNVLLDAHREDSAFHAGAKAAVEALRRQPAPWAVPWPCLHEFIAIATHPGIYQPASSLREALGFVEALLASPQLELLAESPGYFATMPARRLAWSTP